MADGALLGGRRDDGHFADLLKFFPKGGQSGCVDAIVVGEENTHGGGCFVQTIGPRANGERAWNSRPQFSYYCTGGLATSRKRLMPVGSTASVAALRRSTTA